MPTTHAQQVRQNLFLLLLLLVSMAFFGLIKPFIFTVFWAVVLAITFRRFFRILRWRLKGRANLAALLTSLLIIALVVVPVFLILLSLVGQAQGIVEKIQSNEYNVTAIADYIEQNTPKIEQQLNNLGITTDRIRNDLSQLASTIAGGLADQAFGYTKDAVNLTIQFFFMLYMLYFFLRDGREIMVAITNAVPLGTEREHRLIARFNSVVTATLRGTVIVALIQGTIGGVTFALLGIEGALFWGVIMTLLSLLPIGGSGLIWGPTVIILMVQGSYTKGIILLLVGSLVIGLVDNFLRPMLVGRDTKLPDYLVLLSTLGGIAWFGLSGFILGPVIAALFVTCWEIAGKSYGGQAN
ncbi:MAG TPA: AI-2E family transporter [Saprospiraceae bacterium]|nr:AI-2E family transporter [Saprospiraceae bacterium]HMQ81825.1 AI-2E family transporter [Saprospiraceae bacterium]